MYVNHVLKANNSIYIITKYVLASIQLDSLYFIKLVVINSTLHDPSPMSLCPRCNRRSNSHFPQPSNSSVGFERTNTAVSPLQHQRYCCFSRSLTHSRCSPMRSRRITYNLFFFVLIISHYSTCMLHSSVRKLISKQQQIKILVGIDFPNIEDVKREITFNFCKYTVIRR